MRDFTPDTYKLLLTSLLDQNYLFLTFIDFCRNPESGSVILRHDVDAKKMNSLLFARLENELGIKGTYYFRIVPESFDEKVIKQIYDLGHEIGYHYEDVSFIAKRQRRLAQVSEHRLRIAVTNQAENPLGQVKSHEALAQGKEEGTRKKGAGSRELRTHSTKQAEEEIVRLAFSSFSENLEKLRRIVPVRTICMHGSPLSRWDNRLLWKYYDYRDFGIVGEPYFDIDFEKVLYLTDTGRRWDGDAVAVRDKVTGRGGRRDENRFHSTFDIINAAMENILPDKIMLTIHPQRWDGRPIPWFRELVWQNVKNIVKGAVVKKNMS
jgi:hypothetical protein